MTHRDRPIRDDSTRRDATRPPPVERSGTAAAREASLWTEWYQRASPTQQQEALEKAVHEGILFAHQLAAPAHSATAPRSLLASLLNGQAKDLEPFAVPNLSWQDQELDPTQREAVARAVATPDVCLIQGFPGTGKSRVVAEIIWQAAQQGQRVLFLAPNTAALDRVLQRLATNPAVCPIRCLAPDEAPTSLPSTVARLTLPERVRRYHETTLPAARTASDAARHLLEARRHQQTQWVRLGELTEQYEQRTERLRSLTQRQAQIADQVERGEDLSADFQHRRQQEEKTWTQEREHVDGQLAGLRAELETIRDKLNHLHQEWEKVRPLAEARQGRRFWTGSWWRAVMRSGLSEQVRDLEGRRTEMLATERQLEHDIDTLSKERAAGAERYQAAIQRMKVEEITRRQHELDAELAQLAGEQRALREQWQTICQTLPSSEAPPEITRQALASAHAAWELQRQRCEQQAQSAEQWLKTVEDGARQLPEKLAGCANVVAALTTTLAGDPHFGERQGMPSLVFDVLVLEEAHHVTESEFAAAARRAGRWVLLGEPQPDAEPVGPARKVLRPTVLRPGFFERLWSNLHADPHRLPFGWTTRDGRLVCRLRPFTTEQEKWIETEPVLDRPDIELRILAIPRQAPQIVEVLFPLSTSIGEAKQFLFQELEELAVQTNGRGIRWSETSEEVIVELAPSAELETVTVSLGNGVCERLAHLPVLGDLRGKGGIDWHTCSLHFAHSAGWTRPRVEEWLAERLGLFYRGRSVLLTVPYRLDPPLARFLSDLLFGGLCQPAKCVTALPSNRPPVEFVAVPTLTSLEGQSRAESSAHSYGQRGQTAVSVRAPRLRAVKGGAGLELDLADNRPLEQLPGELRSVLPRQGLVNYLEARALVTHLERLVRDEVFRRACEHWRHRRLWPCEHGCASPSICDCPQPDNGAPVAVMALYPAQVQLLRHLIQQSSQLAAAPFAIEVGLPSAFYHRECLLALVSLTRSHTHRAVSYGEQPHALAQALTRAASGLVLFGDPGTLIRRSQWQGPLDHLDESAAQREGQVVGQLVHYLQGHGPHPSAFHVQEGSV